MAGAIVVNRAAIFGDSLIVISHSLNARTHALCAHIVNDAERLDVQVIENENGATVLDFATDRLGTLAGGLALAKICLADLATVSLCASPFAEFPLPWVQVATDFPLSACIGSQYAGWPFSTESFFAMGSGPARLGRGREDILTEYELPTQEKQAVAVLETSRNPTNSDLDELAKECCCPPNALTVCTAKTSSLPGTLQVVARSIETALHKCHELGWNLKQIQRGWGMAPLPPLGSDDYQSMGWTNDSILYGADVTLWVDQGSEWIDRIESIPSQSSSEFGRPFVEIFESYNRDFYQVDRLLFSPARVSLQCVSSGTTATAGQIRLDLLRQSFGWA